MKKTIVRRGINYSTPPKVVVANQFGYKKVLVTPEGSVLTKPDGTILTKG